ncbi:COG1470 family protein [Pengzhenrongella frigida]|uniref:DUF916 domain-containing protein n=1 Tax=Pengzhenrongella frigida TaxID=1259133 RepID=A0A4Q5MWP4_9MICO|nr:DUF916 domain-containing protein [Cellulomonas sp. HLT2-17]RYV49985.1 DUF916 domain-containing protein [Cellulomonas sp. HLT2-17]
MFDHLRRAFAVAAVALTAAFLAAAPALAEAAPSPSPVESDAPVDGDGLASFGIGPASAERPDDRSFLEFSAGPGAVIYDHVAIINQAAAPIDLQVYSGDVVMADGGGLSVTARDQATTDAGSWITVEGPGTIQIPAQSQETGLGYVVVPFSLTIPANAQPGDHLGGIVASLVSAGQGGENSPSIALEQRVAARVYIRVEGPLDPGLDVVDVTATYAAGALAGVRAGTMTVSYTLRNSGNVRLAVEPSVRVAGPFGLLERTAAGERADEILPGGEVKVTTTVPDVWPLGFETVTVSARGVAPTAGEDPGVGTATGSAVVWAFPWAILATLALLIAITIYRVVRARRRKTRRNARRVARARAATQADAPEREAAESVGADQI